MNAGDLRAELLAAALATAERGWPVFPLVRAGKRPALHPATRCPRTGACADGHQGWEQRATTDPDRIRRAWARAPYNIGLPCGPAGLVAIDLDLPKGPDDGPPDGWSRRGVRDGHDVFALVCADAGQPVPADTRTVRTARGGTHLLFRAPDRVQLRNTEGEQGRGLGWKVDTRGHGGYVVAPGSVTPDGVYRLTDDSDPAELPGWLVQRLRPRPPAAPTAAPEIGATTLPRYVTAAVEGEKQRVAAAPGGAHTSTLFVAAVALGQLVGAELLPPATAMSELHAAAQHIIAGRCDCTEAEVLRTIRNGLCAGAGRPRSIRARTPSTAARGAEGGRRAVRPPRASA
jgi:hypothetical protein